jgi:hypothetical protein
MRTTYTGPVKNRGEDAKGRARVSREELADFRRKHGADKTLRDLLNADKTGKTPASEKAPLARGPQGASIAPKAAAKPAGPRRDAAAEAKGAETLERMKSRAGRGMAVRSNEEMRDEAKGRTLGALGAAATMAGGPMLARMAMRPRRPKRTAKAAPRVEPRVGRPVNYQSWTTLFRSVLAPAGATSIEGSRGTPAKRCLRRQRPSPLPHRSLVKRS